MTPKTRGFVNVLLVLLIIILAVLMTGTLTGKKFKKGDPSTAGVSYACCDTGDGDACKPQTDDGQTLTYNGQEYGLLKSNITFAEGVFHLADTGQTFNGNPVIENTSDGYNVVHHAEGSQFPCPGEAIFGATGTCEIIPDDMIMYVCRTNCGPTVPTEGRQSFWCGRDGVTCYGDEKSTYDVFFRLADLDNPGIPTAIKNCVKPENANAPLATPTILVDQQESRENLQLTTFKVIQQSGSIPWLSPWCKPAIYLYPQTTSVVNVVVSSHQPFTYTDPLYPAGGWNVLANPNGDIKFNNKIYNYLYYETRVADSQIKKPEEGFVISKENLSADLERIVKKLGLNKKETDQFVEYWAEVLPDSPYYFVGVVPQGQIARTATLSIIPRPATVIRVTLYFETLNEKIIIDEPYITTPQRSGFTVVEWGGLFKKHKDQPFTCLM